MVTKSKNMDYQVIITNATQGMEIIADLPETFAASLSSNFEGLSGLISGAVPGGDGAAQLIGGDVVFKPFTKLVWRGTAPIEFPLELIFDAETNAKEDVLNILTRLSSLTLPDAGAFGNSDMLSPPNPTRINTTNNLITVRIGRQFYFSSVAVISAQPMTETRLHREGYPIAGGIAMTFQTDTVYSKADWFAACGLDASGLASGSVFSSSFSNYTNSLNESFNNAKAKMFGA